MTDGLNAILSIYSRVYTGPTCSLINPTLLALSIMFNSASDANFLKTLLVSNIDSYMLWFQVVTWGLGL